MIHDAVNRENVEHDPAGAYAQTIVRLRAVGVRPSPALTRLTQQRLRDYAAQLRHRRRVHWLLAITVLVGVALGLAAWPVTWEASAMLQFWWPMSLANRIALVASVNLLPLLIVAAGVLILTEEAHRV